MTNPLTERSSVAAGAFGRHLSPGDQRVVTSRDGHTITITRTSRPYVYDLCDAYNAVLKREDVEWRVDANGNLRLDFRADWSRQNARHQTQRRESESARALQRSFEDIAA